MITGQTHISKAHLHIQDRHISVRHICTYKQLC